MPKARKRQISLDDTPYYHCIARCVRRAFLCGSDPITGFDFEHRRQWIVDRIQHLSSVFAIHICAYAVMSNHYHLVVKIHSSEAESWSEREVARRWLMVFSGNDLIKRWLKGESLLEVERDRISIDLSLWRMRLGDLSWFMRCLNEPIARMANHEDGCTGRFWEGRFKSQALLDERAVLACMAYVDLNPIRAAIAGTPEGSDYTSIQRRIDQPGHHNLYPTSDVDQSSDTLPFSINDYLKFVDWAGRGIQRGKLGSIDPELPPILERMHMDAAPVMDYLGKKEDNSWHAHWTGVGDQSDGAIIGHEVPVGKCLGRAALSSLKRLRRQPLLCSQYL